VPFLHGIRKLAGRFDVFIVDLWGTLHDGIRPYPRAIEALEQLKAQGKTVAFLSNAPRRSAAVARSLEIYGIRPELYDVLLTAGEAAHLALRDRPDAWHRKLAGPCWHLGPPRDRSIFDGLDLELREEPAGCGFCVVTGTRTNEERVEDYQKDLDQALSMGLPMVCANPDISVPSGDALVICAGAFAEYYANKGGDVFWHGKPHAPVYRRLLSLLREPCGGPVDLARTIAIGDALETDIAGAAVIGAASALLVGGVHRREFGVNWRGMPRQSLIKEKLSEAAAKPDYVLRRFAW
jgi:HAD superfamily hydrolase (TIGR01459 family)